MRYTGGTGAIGTNGTKILAYVALPKLHVHIAYTLRFIIAAGTNYARGYMPTLHNNYASF